ncbi:hypothetical protein D3C76_869210 [compost metagenome]
MALASELLRTCAVRVPMRSTSPPYAELKLLPLLPPTVALLCRAESARALLLSETPLLLNARLKLSPVCGTPLRVNS